MRNYRQENLRRFYGISLEEFEDQLRRQNGKCAVCLTTLRVGIEDYKAKDSAVVDHDHDHDFLRGILCQDCNKRLGHAGDSREAFELKYGDYLDHPIWPISGQLELQLDLHSYTL